MRGINREAVYARKTKTTLTFKKEVLWYLLR